jgi:superfamily II helicase
VDCEAGVKRKKPSPYLPGPEVDPKKFTRPIAHKIETMFNELVADEARTPEKIHAVCCVIAKIRARNYEACHRCTRLLTARERMRPCRYCGFKGNYKKLLEEEQSRKKMEELRRKHAEPDFKAADPHVFD